MDPKELFTTAVATAGGCIRHIEDGHMHNATPCSEWDLRQLLNHMTYELLWVPDMLAGRTVAEVGDKYEGDILGDDFHAAWQQAADKAVAAAKDVDMGATVHTSSGDIDAMEYLVQVGGDIFVHAWDADQAVSCSLVLDELISELLLSYYKPQAGRWRKSGLLGPEVPVAASAPYRERLIGLLGRRPMATV
jgi:uncharacterized protein (TIGR03086 family)